MVGRRGLAASCPTLRKKTASLQAWRVRFVRGANNDYPASV